MKLCIDCRHYAPLRFLGMKLRSALCVRPIGLSLVDGKPMISGAHVDVERVAGCGKAAKFFEPKETK